MDRFHLPTAHWAAASLTGEDAHHCARVMRKSVGDEIEVFDGEGRSAPAQILALDRRQVDLELGETTVAAQRTPQIELAVGIPKGKTMDLIIQKAAELGVNRIMPLMTEQGNVQLGDKEVKKKAEKWQRVALEACKQCGQNWLPLVEEPRSLTSWLCDRSHADLEIVGALLPEARSLKELLQQPTTPDSVCFLAGPEGDFSSVEYQEIMNAGFQPATLGSLVLRVETATLLMISAANYEYFLFDD